MISDPLMMRGLFHPRNDLFSPPVLGRSLRSKVEKAVGSP